MNTPQTPDYGEPWKMLSREVGDFTTHPTPHDVNNKQVCDPYRNGLVEDCQKRAERIIACVNACAGMADPAAEIEAMREAIKEAHAIIERYSESAISHANQLMCPECLRIEAFDEEHKDSCAIGKALAKLKSFINHDLRHTTH